MTNGPGKSDRPTVPAKSSNNAGQSAAEGMEGRGFAAMLADVPMGESPLADLTGFSPSQPGLLHPSFPTGWSPFPRSDMTTVQLSKLHRWDFHPLERRLALLQKPLPSIPSAAGCPALFGDFPGTVGLSDFPGPFVIGVRP